MAEGRFDFDLVACVVLTSEQIKVALERFHIASDTSPIVIMITPPRSPDQA